MDNLWVMKKNTKEYSHRSVTISTTFSRKKQVLDYERNYTALDSKQLEALLIEAKENEWKALDLSDCLLDTLPDILWNISSLRVLYIGNFIKEPNTYNTIKEISNKIDQLQNLEALSIRNLKNLVIPDSIKKLPNLVYLDCFGCDFVEIPDNLLNKNLKALGIDISNTDNLIKICKLKKLEELFLSRSQIDNLPPEIGNLEKLQTLFLANSKIKTIPDTLTNLKNIRRLEISGTPLQIDIPEEMQKQSAYDLIMYICKQQKQQKIYTFNESKMIIVGQGNVGKSCLVERITNNHFEEKKESTEGIDVKKWAYTVKGKSYILNIWDFGGQEIYHSTHQFFLTKRSLYIFVWDARAEEEYGRIDYWLKTIESFAEDSPIIIVINKCDSSVTRINRIDFKTYKEQFPQIKLILDISCKDNINIDHLKKAVVDEASTLSITKEKWIKSWLEVREELEKLKDIQRYISYDEFKKICDKYKIQAEEMRSLSKYLHDLGIILHYQDDMVLKGILILSPEWATSAVYRILDSQETILNRRNGILKVSDLPAIWNNSELYPEDKYVFLLKIMQKFQLCFELDKETYLVAELLENTSIDLPDNWNLGEESSIRLVYKYDFMPAGVMTRFIVKIHQYIAVQNEKNLCWKKGVYLQHRSAYASVIMTDTIAEKKIEVKVSKKNNSNHDRELLHIIRMTLNNINSDFKKLKVDEFVPCNCSPHCSFQYPYKTLCHALETNRKTIQCHKSFENVNILKLLEGIEILETEDKGENMYSIKIENKPIITSNIDVDNNLSSTQTNIIDIKELKNTFMEMQGNLSEMQEEMEGTSLDEAQKEILNQIQKIYIDLDKVMKMEQPEQILKSGKLNKLRRLLSEFSDENSETRKCISGGKTLVNMIKELGIGFNTIAKMLGISILPYFIK